MVRPWRSVTFRTSVHVSPENVGAGPIRDRVETGQLAVHIDDHRIVCETRRNASVAPALTALT